MLYNLVRLLITIIEGVVVCCVIIQTDTCKNTNSKTTKVWWISTSYSKCVMNFILKIPLYASVVDLI
jgi:hypothetical protein